MSGESTLGLEARLAKAERELAALRLLTIQLATHNATLVADFIQGMQTQDADKVGRVADDARTLRDGLITLHARQTLDQEG